MEITEELVVRIELLGACADCSMINMTLKGGVESALKKAAPKLKAIEAINLVMTFEFPRTFAHSLLGKMRLNTAASALLRQYLCKNHHDPNRHPHHRSRPMRPLHRV